MDIVVKPLYRPHHRANNRCGQLGCFNHKVSVAQVKTCVDSFYIPKKYIHVLRSHFLGHLCRNISRFASNLVDTIYWVLNIPTNRITYNCELNSVTHVTKFKEAFGIYIDESVALNTKCQWVLALTASKFTLKNTSYWIECLTVFCFVTLNVNGYLHWRTKLLWIYKGDCVLVLR